MSFMEMLEACSGTVESLLHLLTGFFLVVVAALMFRVYRSFSKGEFRSIAFWTFVMVTAVGLHEVVRLCAFYLFSGSLGQFFIELDEPVHFLTMGAVIVSAFFLIRNFQRFAGQFGLVRRLKDEPLTPAREERQPTPSALKKGPGRKKK